METTQVNVILKVLETSYVTHDVKRFIIEKPPGFNFIPGQSVNISINQPGWEKKERPFTFTNVPGDAYLELMIKIYRFRNGVTKQLDAINAGDELILHDVFGAIQYKDRGVFMAAGSGITPFLSIFRQLYINRQIQGNSLIYSNKTSSDVMMEEELKQMLGDNFIQTFTRENVIGFIDRRIDRDFLIANITDFNQQFYICGPESFISDLKRLLEELGAASESIIFEP